MKYSNNYIHRFIKFYKLNVLFNTMSVIIFFYLIYASINNSIAILCSIAWLILIMATYYKNTSIQIKYLLGFASMALFILILYITKPIFVYIAQFVYCVPLLYALSFKDLLSPSLYGLGIIFIFFTYIGKVADGVIKATTIGLLFACVGYTVNSKLVKKLNKDNEKLYNMSITDNLTGLFTLSYIIESGQKMLETGNNVTAVIIDLDYFKKFNDTYGHLIANKVLVRFGELLKLKTSHLNSIVGRLGGDEFIVIARNYDTKGKTLSKAINDSIKNELYEVEKGLDKMKIEFSIGEASINLPSSETMEELLNKANINMYYNKFSKNNVHARIELNVKTMSPQCIQLLQTLAEKDMYTYIHSQYTAQYAVALGKAINLQDHVIKDLNIAGWFHDIGKVLITNNILRKNSKLDHYEYRDIKKHVINGLHILESCNFSDTTINAILFHHERWDGIGYPNEIPGKNTPIEGRILQIADAFSAMTVRRVYHEPLSIEHALIEIQANSGTQFDPQLSKTFINMLNDKRVAI